MRIENNHARNQCHPETCSCADWALVDDNDNVISRDDDLEYLEDLMKRKKNEQKEKQSK